MPANKPRGRGDSSAQRRVPDSPSALSRGCTTPKSRAGSLAAEDDDGLDLELPARRQQAERGRRPSIARADAGAAGFPRARSAGVTRRDRTVVGPHNSLRGSFVFSSAPLDILHNKVIQAVVRDAGSSQQSPGEAEDEGKLDDDDDASDVNVDGLTPAAISHAIYQASWKLIQVMTLVFLSYSLFGGVVHTLGFALLVSVITHPRNRSQALKDAAEGLRLTRQDDGQGWWWKAWRFVREALSHVKWLFARVSWLAGATKLCGFWSTAGGGRGDMKGPADGLWWKFDVAVGVGVVVLLCWNSTLVSIICAIVAVTAGFVGASTKDEETAIARVFFLCDCLASGLFAFWMIGKLYTEVIEFREQVVGQIDAAKDSYEDLVGQGNYTQAAWKQAEGAIERWMEVNGISWSTITLFTDVWNNSWPGGPAVCQSEDASLWERIRETAGHLSGNAELWSNMTSVMSSEIFSLTSKVFSWVRQLASHIMVAMSFTSWYFWQLCVFVMGVHSLRSTEEPAVYHILCYMQHSPAVAQLAQVRLLAAVSNLCFAFFHTFLFHFTITYLATGVFFDMPLACWWSLAAGAAAVTHCFPKFWYPLIVAVVPGNWNHHLFGLIVFVACTWFLGDTWLYDGTADNTGPATNAFSVPPWLVVLAIIQGIYVWGISGMLLGPLVVIVLAVWAAVDPIADPSQASPQGSPLPPRPPSRQQPRQPSRQRARPRAGSPD
eukprot:TRINITY_DN65440_c0_g1_i1.p1 TRINITY_DN65440_c0_g1~~TRINITY_DN65440_c0_g1_i1.p1  ORF type:complete len:752 (+),score=169.48 TRINITY_DN65440_c0_g1_i1:102-2258(+)